jgi:hypothetical protein
MFDKVFGHLLQLFNIYAPNNCQEKKLCWETLRTYGDTLPFKQRMLVGDLNLVFGPLNNKKGSYVYDPY